LFGVFWGNFYASGAVAGFSSTDLARGNTTDAAKVAFNLADWVTLLQQRESLGGMISFHHEINPRVSAFGDVLAARIVSFSQLAPFAFLGTVEASNVTNPFDATTTARARLLYAPRQYNWRTAYGRLLTGLKGQLGERLQFETALNLSRSRLNFTMPGALFVPNLQSAVTDGRINLFPRIVSPAELAAANALGIAVNRFVSTLYSWDGRLISDAFDLPAGPIHWTVGTEYRRERLAGSADEKSIPDPVTGAPGWGGGTSSNPFGGRRAVSSIFAAIKVPLISPAQTIAWSHSLDATLDARGEHYSDMPDPMVPRAGFRWLPFDRHLAVRGGIGRAFSAPTLYQLSGPPSVGMTEALELIGTDGRLYTGQAHRKNPSNSKLKPETARSVSVGIEYSPPWGKGVSMALDYAQVRQRGIIGQIDSREALQDVELRGADSAYVAGHPNSIPGFDTRLVTGFDGDGARVTAPGQIANRLASVYFTNPTVNLGTREVKAVDFLLNYTTTPAPGRLFEASLRVAYTASDLLNGRESAGRATDVSGTTPRWSAITALQYQHRAWQFMLLHRAVASVFAVRDGFETGDYHTCDLGIGYRLGRLNRAEGTKWELSLRVKNVADVEPRRAPLTFTANNADIGTYDPLGRTWVISAEHRF
jgi:iron complex outermembrane receptor protein